MEFDLEIVPINSWGYTWKGMIWRSFYTPLAVRAINNYGWDIFQPEPPNEFGLRYGHSIEEVEKLLLNWAKSYSEKIKKAAETERQTIRKRIQVE